VTNNERAHLYVAANTHPGMKGKNNEDRYAISAHRLGSKKNIPAVLAIVCDGIGGHRAGEVAAEIAVETISKTVVVGDPAQPLATLRKAIQDASEAVRVQSDSNSERRGMGATCVCVWAIGDRMYTASVGDSRLYLVRDDQIRQLTTDHTWIQEAIEYGALTPEQARGHPNAHVIRRYLGSKTPTEPDFRLRLHPDETDEQAEANQGMHLKSDDILLLCSDGLTDLVEDQEIKTILQGSDRETAVQNLIDLANERGGHDNITVVTLTAPASLAASPPVIAPKEGLSFPSRRLTVGCVIAVVLMTFLAVTAAGLYWYYTDGRLGRADTATPGTTSLPGIQSTLKATLLANTPTTMPLVETAIPSASPDPNIGPQAATYTPWPTHTIPPTATDTLEPTPTQPTATLSTATGNGVAPPTGTGTPEIQP